MDKVYVMTQETHQHLEELLDKLVDELPFNSRSQARARHTRHIFRTEVNLSTKKEMKSEK